MVTKRQETQENHRAIPGYRHIGLIPDGNRRWARRRNLSDAKGHIQGARNVKDVVCHARTLGIEAMTVFIFSTENWNRSPLEVAFLMRLIQRALRLEIRSLHENNIRLRFLGDKTRLPPSLQKIIRDCVFLTRNNSGMCLQMALNYGGRTDIVQAARTICGKVLDKRIRLDDITTDLLDQNLYTHPLPPVDLVIRTGGNMRLSNFMLWQLADAECRFLSELWPDFTLERFSNVLTS